MILSYKNFEPIIDTTCFIATNATVIGKVKLNARVSIWYGAVLRGDVDCIELGEGSNIQDNAVVHCDHGTPTLIGKYVTIGHGAIIHACDIGDNTLIGMGAVILSGAKIGKHCIVGAGALVTGSTTIPDHSMVFGSPAKVIRSVTNSEIEQIKENASNYIKYAEDYK